MAVPVILRGDDTAFRGTSLSIVLPEGDYAGLRVRFRLLGIVREWDSPAGGAELPIDLAAVETAGLPLGTHFARIDVANYAGAGYVVSDTIRVRVTDDVADATGADNAIHVQPGGGGGFSPDLDGIDGDPATPEALKGAFSLLLERLRAAAGAFALLALASLSCGLLRADGLEVQTAPLGGLPWATPVVTNVTGASGITTNDVRAIVADATNGMATAGYVDESISAAVDNVVRLDGNGGIQARGDISSESGLHTEGDLTAGGVRVWDGNDYQPLGTAAYRDVSSFAAADTGRASTNYTDAAIFAATNNLPQPTPGDPYATRPWWIAAEYVPIEPAHAVTNGDVWAWAYGGAAGIGARLSLEVDDRPTAYAYPPPDGEWHVLGGTLDEDTLVVTPTSDVVRVSFEADDGTAKSSAFNVRSASPGAAGEPVAPVAGTWRAACMDALLSRFAAGTNSAAVVYPWCRPAAFSSTFCSWTNRAAFQRFGDGSGEWYGLPTAANAGFFWPQLAASLAPYSVAKGDKPGTWGDSQILVVSPHYAIGAAHAGHFGGAVATNQAPLAIMRNSVAHGVLAENGRTYYYGIPTSTSPSKVGDAQVVRFRDAFPSNCIARLADAATLAALSPSFPVRWPAFQSSQHQSFTPVSIAGTTTNAAGVVSVSMRGAWAAEGFDGLLDFIHHVHIYDSSSLVGTAGPQGQLVPLFLFYTTGGGPALFGVNVEAIDAIIQADSDGTESVWRWTPEELQ